MHKGNKSFIWVCIGLFAMACNNNASRVFKRLSADQTGIHFSNAIREDEQHNMLTYTNIYTGAGVAAGDINNDGLTDLYFSGNMVTGRLFLNKGSLKFEDITESAGLTTTRWGTGTSMVDINQDGWLDIYVCVSGSATDGERANLLYINNGITPPLTKGGAGRSDVSGVTFTESAAAYGLADTRQVMNAAFFDYDRDGDLDLFMIVNSASLKNNVNVIQSRQLKGEATSTDVLYRNDTAPADRPLLPPSSRGVFTDVSKEAGILTEGYSLGLAISDINNDGWPDVYISNDFISNDVLYINNHNGAFTDQAATFLKHTSYAGMGNDVADINNDGLVDIVELDMRPEDNLRQKLIIPASSYDRFQLSLEKGYQPQYSRNTLQLNQGNNKFSEIGFLSGISSTDWSWSALLADYDNDGDRDLFVTNGFLRDLGDMDYVHYQNIYNSPMGVATAKLKNKLEAIKSLKGVPLRNYLFENEGNLTFENRSEAWGIDVKGFSNGAVYVDLDNDGDLELVVNNINDEAHVYENRSNTLFKRNFLRLKLKGSAGNRNGIGTKVSIRYQGKIQFYEHFLSRGYESSVDPVIHFGLGGLATIDSVEIDWPDGKYQLLTKVKANQLLQVDYASARDKASLPEKARRPALFAEVTQACGIDYMHRENDYVDFKVQPLLPHLHSRNGPGVAVGDINGDGRDDFYVGGATGYAGAMFVQGADGQFERKPAPGIDTLSEQMGVLFFDADNDQDVDLYIASGGSEHPEGSALYTDHLYLNDGKGNFSPAIDALPDLRQSGSSVVAADYDRDGDLDLFVGGSVSPGQYPLPPRSYLLQNNGGKFRDVTAALGPALQKIGMVTAALWTDFDNDQQPDLLLAGEWMPLTFFKNQHGKLVAWNANDGKINDPVQSSNHSVTQSLSHQLTNSTGWWNSLTAGDFDNDGDTDYLAGNLGLNTRYRASEKEPLCIHASDYNKDGLLDPVMSYYIQGKRYISHARDDLNDQIREMRVRFRTYRQYAETSFDESFLPEELAKAYVVCSERMESSYLENLGGGRFRIRALPIEAQFAPVYGMVTGDYDGDGHLDVLLTGNSYATEVSTGRYDASLGLYLQGDGKGHFTPVQARESGFQADDDAKGMAKLALTDGRELLVVGNNASRVRVYAHHQPASYFRAERGDAYARVTLANGKTYKHEFYYGSTYLSQSARMLRVTDDVSQIKVTDYKGITRLIKLGDIIPQ